MYIHLPGRCYNVNLLHPQALLSEQSLQVCPYCVFSGLFLDDMQLLCLTSPGCLYRLEFISCILRQVVSGLPARLFFCRQVLLGRFEWFPRQIFRQLASAFSSELKFLDARNLTCLQRLSNVLYTNHNTLLHEITSKEINANSKNQR